jgi:hypothetical protein
MAATITVARRTLSYATPCPAGIRSRGRVSRLRGFAPRVIRSHPPGVAFQTSAGKCAPEVILIRDGDHDLGAS